MRAILVCVDFHDFLALTLPYNQHHFKEIWVVTSPRDEKTQALCEHFRSLKLPVRTVVTDLFYDQGAEFNKWAALEHGLDCMGREGWLTIMDADILWPHGALLGTYASDKVCGFLYTPKRRMLENVHGPNLPPEEDWSRYPYHRYQLEWSGYSQIFHAQDPHLGKPPWHETNWRHAGGADSSFQNKWPKERKLRPNFEVLHLGESGLNWCGRVSPYLGGERPEEAAYRQQRLLSYFRQRQACPPERKYLPEKLPKPSYTTEHMPPG